MPLRLSDSSRDTDIAGAVVALAEQEYARRIAAGETNHVDEEDYFLPRWRALLRSGDVFTVLVEAVGYLESSRVSLCPANPAYAHKKTPNYDLAQRLLRRIARTAAGTLHEEVKASVQVEAEGCTLIVQSFAPLHACFSAYRWMSHAGWFICFSAGTGFCRYDIVAKDAAEAYMLRFEGIRAHWLVSNSTDRIKVAA